MNKITVIHGSEGPRHDPYGYVEVQFTKQHGTVIEAHIGDLSAWIKVNGKKLPIRVNSDDCDTPGSAVVRMFFRITGIKVSRAISIPDIILQKKLRHMSKEDRNDLLACMAAEQSMLRNCY